MFDRLKTSILLIVAVVFLLAFYSSQHDKTEAANKELRARNAYAALMPLVELYTESGPVDKKTKEVHTELFDRYIENINNHQLSLPLRPFALFAKKIDVKELGRIRDKVEYGASKEIYQAAIEELFDELKQFLSKENILSRKSDVPPGIRTEVANKLEELNIKTLDYISSIDLSDDSKIGESINDAVNVCLASREAIAYSFLASYTYEDFFANKEPLLLFREDIDRAIYCNKFLYNSLPVKGKTDEETDKYNGYRDRLKKYSHSEFRRRDVVQALIDDDMQKARELLLAAMEKAISGDSLSVAK